MIYQPDSFDFYGSSSTGRANMLLGDRWASIDSNLRPQTTNPHTGTHSLSVDGFTTNGARKVWPSALTTKNGIMFNFNCAALPILSNSFVLWQVYDFAMAQQLNFILQPTGAIEVKRGTAAGGTRVAISANNVVVPGNYPRIQLACKIHGSTGLVQGEVNGVSIFNNTGINTASSANIETSQFAILISPTGVSVGNTYLDNLVPWYDDGGDNSDMLAEKVCHTFYMNADTADTDWIRNTGASDYEAIDDTTPDDISGTGTYIETSTATDESAFGIPLVPVDDILAVSIPYLTKKVGSSVCKLQAALKGTLGTNGAENSIDTNYGYKTDTFQRDPDAAGTPGITAAGLDLLRWSITRTV